MTKRSKLLLQFGAVATVASGALAGVGQNEYMNNFAAENLANSAEYHATQGHHLTKASRNSRSSARVGVWAIARTTAFDSTMKILLEKPHPRSLSGLARNDHATSGILETVFAKTLYNSIPRGEGHVRISADEKKTIFVNLASNPNLGTHLIQSLSESRDSEVLISLLENKNISIEEKNLSRIMKNSSDKTVVAMAEHIHSSMTPKVSIPSTLDGETEEAKISLAMK